MTDVQTVKAFPVNGVGGFVTATPQGGAHAILTYVLPSGELLHLALSDEMLKATESKCLELRTVLMDANETLRDLRI